MKSDIDKIENNKVSIIMPCFNHGLFIKEALESALESTYKNIEIIIIDDGSNDDYTKEILSKIKDSKVKILYQKNQGPAAARNYGIRASSGKYILPLDSDDKIHKDYIKKAVSIMENNKEIGIVYCEAEFFGKVTGKWELPEFNLKRFLNVNCIFVTSLFKKEDWLKVGGYKEIMKRGLEDWEFYISLIENGCTVYRIPEILFFYRKNRDSRSEIKKEDNIILYKTIMKLHPKIYMDNIEDIFPLFEKIFGKKKSKLRKIFRF